MSILSTLKNTFLPSESVSAQRRLNTFGSTSKVKAGTIIIGTSAVVGVAGVVAGLSGATAKAVTTPIVTKSLQTAGTSIVNVAKKNPIKTAIIAPIVALQLATNKSSRKVAGEVVSDTVGFVGDLGTAKTTEDVYSAVKNNPYGAFVTGLTVAGTGAGLYYTAKTLTEMKSSKDNVTDVIYNNTQPVITKIPDTIPSVTEIPLTLPPAEIPKSTGLTPSPVPITPQTQVIGKSAGVSNRTRKNLSSKYKQPMLNMHFTINNQNKNTKYLKISR